ncbi:hypothetical protein AK812_SmicGene43120 [Symbiodinium microadriaticum]|uniref:Uncharacterized protein n=1 Tax=Symbiodinium microadriaticum TaxID=2951 RepID=A0A1Q9C1T6_SYMMI|nr:hypothetical protein AK812_SmicGene43120 [Symbiodinium microadriaticum]
MPGSKARLTMPAFCNWGSQSVRHARGTVLAGKHIGPVPGGCADGISLSWAEKFAAACFQRHRTSVLAKRVLAVTCVDPGPPSAVLVMQFGVVRQRGPGTAGEVSRRVSEQAMRCRYLSPPDVDVSVLVGERTLHNLASDTSLVGGPCFRKLTAEVQLKFEDLMGVPVSASKMDSDGSLEVWVAVEYAVGRWLVDGKDLPLLSAGFQGHAAMEEARPACTVGAEDPWRLQAQALATLSLAVRFWSRLERYLNALKPKH